MNTISTRIKEYLDKNLTLSGPGGQFTGKDFLNLTEILNDTKRNFVIFDNAGGKPFDIMLFDEEINIQEIKELIQVRLKNYVFMYQIKGEQVIVNELPGIKIFSNESNCCQCDKPLGDFGFCTVCDKLTINK